MLLSSVMRITVFKIGQSSPIAHTALTFIGKKKKAVATKSTKVIKIFK